MAISAIAAAGIHAAAPLAGQSVSQHRHAGHRSPSLTDVDAAGSSAASAPSPTGKVGSKIDLIA